MIDPEKKKSPKKSPNNWVKYSGMGIQMAGVIAVGTWGGVELDKHFNYKFPVFTVVLTLIAVFSSIYIAIRDFIK